MQLQPEEQKTLQSLLTLEETLINEFLSEAKKSGDPSVRLRCEQAAAEHKNHLKILKKQLG